MSFALFFIFNYILLLKIWKYLEKIYLIRYLIKRISANLQITCIILEIIISDLMYFSFIISWIFVLRKNYTQFQQQFRCIAGMDNWIASVTRSFRIAQCIDGSTGQIAVTAIETGSSSFASQSITSLTAAPKTIEHCSFDSSGQYVNHATD